MISADKLRFSYRRDAQPVITEFDHEFDRGSVTALVGPSGCGKSTLLYLIGLLLTPTGGAIRWDGTAVSSLSDHERSRMRAERVGFIFQDAILDPSRTILDNVIEGGLYGPTSMSDLRTNARTLLQRFGVSEGVDRRPGEVSGGQAQRVAICRALVKRPDLILADEPSGNLDEANADVVWQTLLDAAAEGITVIVATHDLHRSAQAGTQINL